jgi:cobalt/nickel transport system permease protein
MHIPDGFLSVLVALVCWLGAVVVIAIALRRTGRTLGERQVPMMGVLAAAIFAGQMLNFSIAGGTSGHLLGAALAAIILGLWPAVIVMTTVVSVQALLFQDGGLLALGANLFNMAVIGVFVSYGVYNLLSGIFRRYRWSLFVSGFAAAWSSIVASALACALQLALSGTSPANIAVPAMGSIHALIGIGEGLITVGALALISTARPDIVQGGQARSVGEKSLVLGGIAIALALAGLAPLASSHPDGLEWVAEQKGFIHLEQSPLYQIFPNYVLPGIQNKSLATIGAGILGVLIVFGVVILVGRSRKR